MRQISSPSLVACLSQTPAYLSATSRGITDFCALQAVKSWVTSQDRGSALKGKGWAGHREDQVQEPTSALATRPSGPGTCSPLLPGSLFKAQQTFQISACAVLSRLQGLFPHCPLYRGLIPTPPQLALPGKFCWPVSSYLVVLSLSNQDPVRFPPTGPRGN